MAKSSDKSGKGETGGRVWDRFAIRAEIHRRGSTLTKIAKNYGLSDAACRKALVTPFPAGERAIAKYLRLPIEVVFPDRYDEAGRRRPSPRAKTFSGFDVRGGK